MTTDHDYYIRNGEHTDPVYIGQFADEYEATAYLDVWYPVTYPLVLYCDGITELDHYVGRRSCLDTSCHWAFATDFMYSDWYV